jgi:hypothetical protein
MISPILTQIAERSQQTNVECPVEFSQTCLPTQSLKTLPQSRSQICCSSRYPAPNSQCATCATTATSGELHDLAGNVKLPDGVALPKYVIQVVNSPHPHVEGGEQEIIAFCRTRFCLFILSPSQILGREKYKSQKPLSARTVGDAIPVISCYVSLVATRRMNLQARSFRPFLHTT